MLNQVTEKDRRIFVIGFLAIAVGLLTTATWIDVFCALVLLWAGLAAIAQFRAHRRVQAGEEKPANEAEHQVPTQTEDQVPVAA